MTIAHEQFRSFYLDTKLQIIGIEMISKGTLNAIIIYPREVFKGAPLANAHAIIIAHNHPSGNVETEMQIKQLPQRLLMLGSSLK